MEIIMNLAKLNEKFKGCECGKEHTCPIDYVILGSGAVNELPSICEKYDSIILVSDTNTYEVCGKIVEALLGDKLEASIVLKPNGDVVIPNEEKIAEIEQKLTPKTELIIGVGSGVINDLCKQVSFTHDLYYYIVATAPSMDGYASVGSALILEGMKITLNARPPKAIIGDTDVLKYAPMPMLQAGYGDIIGKYSCLNDWKLAALINGEYFCGEIYDLTLSQAKTVRKFAKKILERDGEAVEALMEALVTVGVAMSYVDNSRPASGSEHHLSHFFEITGILNGEEYYPHGIDVMYSAAETAKIREEILASEPSLRRFDREKWTAEIKRIYSSSADGIIALQDKLAWYDIDDSDVIHKKWNDMKEVLKEAPTFEENLKMLDEIGLSYDEFVKFYTRQKVNDAVLYAKDLKDRYSILWLYYKYFKGEN